MRDLDHDFFLKKRYKKEFASILPLPTEMSGTTTAKL
jgi:hypothetical protein